LDSPDLVVSAVQLAELVSPATLEQVVPKDRWDLPDSRDSQEALVPPDQVDLLDLSDLGVMWDRPDLQVFTYLLIH